MYLHLTPAQRDKIRSEHKKLTQRHAPSIVYPTPALVPAPDGNRADYEVWFRCEGGMFVSTNDKGEAMFSSDPCNFSTHTTAKIEALS